MPKTAKNTFWPKPPTGQKLTFENPVLNISSYFSSMMLGGNLLNIQHYLITSRKLATLIAKTSLISGPHPWQNKVA